MAPAPLAIGVAIGLYRPHPVYRKPTHPLSHPLQLPYRSFDVGRVLDHLHHGTPKVFWRNWEAIVVPQQHDPAGQGPHLLSYLMNALQLAHCLRRPPTVFLLLDKPPACEDAQLAMTEGHVALEQLLP